MSLSDDDVKFFLDAMSGSLGAYNALESVPDHLPHVKYPRTRGYRPEGEENPYNAWYYKSEIKGAPTGKLAGKRVALKDNVCLAGVPMMNGASTLEADRVIYDQRTKRLHAEGSVRLTQPDGTVTYGEIMDLSDDFRDGFVDSLRADAPEQGAGWCCGYCEFPQ